MTAPSKRAEEAAEASLLWALSFASGYHELGMSEKAERELDKLPYEQQDLPAVMALRSRILVARRQWPRVIEHARRAVRLFPQASEFYVHAATACDMLGLPAEGRNIWMMAPRSIRASGFFHLHVARFEAKLGNVDAAREHLASAFRLDPALRSVAGHDPSLAALLSGHGKN